MYKKTINVYEYYRMNLSEMQKLLDWLIDVDIDTFNMKRFVGDNKVQPECSSQNCILGNYINHRIRNGETDRLVLFSWDTEYWSEERGNIINYTDTTLKILDVRIKSNNFELLFGSIWSNEKLDNSKEFAIQRIEFLMDLYTAKRRKDYIMLVDKIYEAVTLYTLYKDKPGFDYKDFFKKDEDESE